MSNLDTFPKLLEHNAERFAARPAIREKALGIWQNWTWTQVRDETHRLASGLAARGFSRGDKLFIVGDNRPSLYWAQGAAQALGGIPVPTYQESVAEEMKYVIEHADVKYVVAENQEQVDKILEVMDAGLGIELVVYDDPRGMRHYSQPHVVSFDALQEEGDAFARANPNHLTENIALGSTEDDAVMLYTSGTTGNPKGVVLTYTNLLFSAKTIIDIEGLDEHDSAMAYLPMAWIIDHLFSYAVQHVCGACICCPESTETALADKSEIGPSFHFTSPRVLENHHTNLMTRIEDAAAIKRRMFAYFTALAERVGVDLHDGKPVSMADRLLYTVGKFLVYEPIKNVLGYGKTRVTYTAGEAIGPEMFNFYRSLGINLKQVYGQTEASPFVTVQLDDCVRSDTVGVQIPETEVRITEQGEVTFRGPGAFRHYYKNPEATAETKDEEGWVHTGDAGFFDHEGQLKIIDRVKDVGKLADGSMFAPKYIENKLKFSPFILEAVAHGHERSHSVVMVNIDLEAVGNWAERRNIPYASYQELANRPEVYELVRADVERVNQDLCKDKDMSSSQIRRFLVLHKELDADDGELTRTRKIRRRVVAEKYATLVEALYSDQSECHVETLVRFEDGREGTLAATVRLSEAETYDSTEQAA